MAAALSQAISVGHEIYTSEIALQYDAVTFFFHVRVPRFCMRFQERAECVGVPELVLNLYIRHTIALWSIAQTRLREWRPQRMKRLSNLIAHNQSKLGWNLQAHTKSFPFVFCGIDQEPP